MKHTKRFLALALALVLLLSLTGTAFATGEEAPAEEAVLTIYEQTGEEGEATLLASYTESEYAALLTEGRLTYGYMSKPFTMTVAGYVTLSELLGEAFGSGDTLRYTCLEKDGSVQEYKKDCARSYEDLIETERYYYAAADAEGVVVPSVLSPSRRLYVGETDGYRTMSGSFWPSGIVSITIVHPAAETSPEAQEPDLPTDSAAGKRIYFAAPLFSQAEQEYNLKLTKVLEDHGYEVFLPQRDGYLAAELEGKTEEELTQMIFDKDVGEVLAADIVFVLLDGRVPDEGACVELGIAYASGKRCYGFKTDARTVERSLDLNPMISGCFVKLFSDIDGERLIAELERYLSENEL